MPKPGFPFDIEFKGIAMFTTEINGYEEAPILVESANNSVHINRDAIAVSGITEPTKDATGIHDNTYLVDGWLQNLGVVINIGGNRDTVNIGETGHVFGIYSGILLSGDANRISNSGEIVGGFGAVGISVIGGTGTQIRNGGLITGDRGVDFEGHGGLIVNGTTGIIAGNDYALLLSSSDISGTTFINHGHIVGSNGLAFQSEGAVAVINDGTIKGDVNFDLGSGTLDNRGGVIKGAILGGVGDDTLITDSAKYQLTEQADHGLDTVKSTVSYKLNDNVESLILIGKANVDARGNAESNFIRGNVGDNLLKGEQADDDLLGGEGDDKLFGGSGADHFFFSTGYGHDIIEDYHANEDAVDLTDWRAIGSVHGVFAHAHADHGNTIIEAGSDSLTLTGIHLADLDTVHFVFVT
jgi:Ca2+-binding RTX toxin-like protein